MEPFVHSKALLIPWIVKNTLTGSAFYLKGFLSKVCICGMKVTCNSVVPLVVYMSIAKHVKLFHTYLVLRFAAVFGSLPSSKGTFRSSNL